MATYTGKLTDFGMQPQPGLKPIITFKAESGVSGDTILFDRPIDVEPAADGTFSVSLQPLDVVFPARYYKITVRWLDASGNMAGYSEVPGRFFPIEPGGPIGEYIRGAGTAPGLTWYGLTPPPERGSFTSWLYVDPADPNNLLHPEDPSYGDYYEWN